MKNSIKKGLSFGLTSGVITTLGVMVGLYSGTRSDIVVLGGVFTIAIADAMSDSLGIHVSEEAELEHSSAEIWESTFSTFFSKFLFTLTFAIPILIFNLTAAIVISVVYGLLLISSISWLLARLQGIKPYKVIGEHLLIATVVIVATHYVGEWTSTLG